MPSYGNTTFQSAAPGISKLALALGGGSGAYEGARENEIMLQSKLAQALSSQQLNEAKMAEMEGAAQRGSPDAIRRNVLTGYGVPLQEDQAVVDYLNTGKLGGRYAEPGDGVGPTLPAPEWAGNLGNIGRAIMAAQNALAVGDKNSLNIPKAAGEFRNQSLSDAIIAGTADRNRVGGAQAAVEGKELFNRDSTGSVLDQYTGTLNTANPLAQATIKQRGNTGAMKAPQGYQYVTGEDGAPRLAAIPGGPKDPAVKPQGQLPTAALKMQNEELDAISTAGAINSDLDAITSQIEGGKLQLGVINNAAGSARNMLGFSNESSRNLQSFKSTLERLRNDSLRLNKGVQTDGDAQRAWNELLTNINDPEVVKQRLMEIQRINERAAEIRAANIAAIRSNFGLQPLETQQRFQQPAAIGAPAAGARTQAPKGWSIQREGN